MYFLKILCLNLCLFSLSSFAEAKNSSPPIDDHICNEILEHGKEQISKIRKPQVRTIFGGSYSESTQERSVLNEAYFKRTRTRILYGQCLLLNSENNTETEEIGISILEKMIKNSRNVYSALFLAQYYEMENYPKGERRERERERVISAYKTTNVLVNELIAESGFGTQLVFSFFVFFKPGPWPARASDLLVRLAGNKKDQDDHNESLFVNSRNYFDKMYISYYKLPQLIWFRFSDQLKGLEANPSQTDENIRESMSIGGLSNSEGTSSQIAQSTFMKNEELSLSTKKIDDSLMEMKESAENCMTFMEENVHRSYILFSLGNIPEETSVPLYDACEELRDIALDFLDGRRQITDEEELKSIDRRLIEQEEELRVIFSVEWS